MQIRFSRKHRLFALWALLIALNVGGLILSGVRLAGGTLSQSAFSYTLLHFFVSIFTISAVFLAEWVLRFTAGEATAAACMLFAFFGNSVSNVWRMYDCFPQWDMVLHSLSGVLFAVVGLGLALLLLRDIPEGGRKVLAVLLFALFFSLAVGYLWEVFEFTVDTISPSMSTQGWADGILESYPDGTYLVNSRRGTAILDTMEDMILHLLGSLITLVPLAIVFWKRQSRMKAFSFVPLPRRSKKEKSDPALPDESKTH